MKRIMLLAAIAALFSLSTTMFTTALLAQTPSTKHAFGFNSASISGFPTGSARLTGFYEFQMHRSCWRDVEAYRHIRKYCGIDR